MNELLRLLRDPSLATGAMPEDGQSRAPCAHISSLLHLVSSTEPISPWSNPQPALKDWSPLVDLVRAAGHRSRDIEAQMRLQEAQFEELLHRVRDGIIASDERARSSEATVQHARLRLEAQITAAEDRAAAAEERASHAEGWLARVHETILSEFAELTVAVAA